MSNLVECELAQILIVEQTNAPQVIVLRERGGRRSFPISIGIFEAMAINRHVSGEEMIRPMTHDLMVSIIEKLGGTLKAIVVHDLLEDANGHGTFYGRLIIECDGREIDVDTRPSDAVALAVRTGCKVFVAEHVLAMVAREH